MIAPRPLAAVMVGVLVASVEVGPAAAGRRQLCRETCAMRMADECGDLARRGSRRCRKRIVRTCRQRGLQHCLPPSTTTTTATTTSEPTPTTVTATSSTTLPISPCGNDVIDPGEKCDGTSVGEGHCLGGGPVKCLQSCLGWSYSDCYSCQNGVREGFEECDGADLGDAECPAESTGGSPVCKTSCKLDYGPCIVCGDGQIDPGEFCDDGNTVAGDGCSPTCGDECGDGLVQPPLEMCDDGGESNGDGCTAFCEILPMYDGGGDEADDACALQWGVSTSSGLGEQIICADGHASCDRGPANDQLCRFLVYACVNNPSFTVPCGWTGVARVALVGDSVSGPDALTDAEQTIVLGAFESMAEWAGGAVSGTNPVRETTPVLTAAITCGQFALDVASGSTKAVVVQIEDGRDPAGVDVDSITLACAGAD